MLGSWVWGTGRRLSASILTIPNNDSTRVSAVLKRLVDVTRKVWPTVPSKLPCTWHPSREQRFKTEESPPVETTIYRCCAAAGFGAANMRTIIAIMMVMRFIVLTLCGALLQMNYSVCAQLIATLVFPGRLSEPIVRVCLPVYTKLPAVLVPWYQGRDVRKPRELIAVHRLSPCRVPSASRS